MIAYNIKKSPDCLQFKKVMRLPTIPVKNMLSGRQLDSYYQSFGTVLIHHVLKVELCWEQVGQARADYRIFHLEC